MAFAQFYYDPAVEFEKLLDEQAYAPNVPSGDVPSTKQNTVSDPSGLPYVKPSPAAETWALTHVCPASAMFLRRIHTSRAPSGSVDNRRIR